MINILEYWNFGILESINSLPLLGQIEIYRTHISTPTHDHVVNPDVLFRISRGIGLGCAGLETGKSWMI